MSTNSKPQTNVCYIQNLQEMKVICKATIQKIELEYGWYYTSCKNCRKKLKAMGNKLFCDYCAIEPESQYQGTKPENPETTFCKCQNMLHTYIIIILI